MTKHRRVTLRQNRRDAGSGGKVPGLEQITVRHDSHCFEAEKKMLGFFCEGELLV